MQPSSPDQGWLARILWPLRFRIENLHVMFKQSLLHRQEQRRLNDENGEEEPIGFAGSIRSRLRGSLFSFFDIDPLAVDPTRSGKEILRTELSHRRTHFLDRLKLKLSLKERAYDYVFYLLDYDPTHHESGERDMRLSPALMAWFFRVVLSRWIEIVGIVSIIVVGLICYFAI